MHLIVVSINLPCTLYISKACHILKGYVSNSQNLESKLGHRSLVLVFFFFFFAYLNEMASWYSPQGTTLYLYKLFTLKYRILTFDWLTCLIM